MLPSASAYEQNGRASGSCSPTESTAIKVEACVRSNSQPWSPTKSTAIKVAGRPWGELLQDVC